jgi:uncharacterized DUF497 family protein
MAASFEWDFDKAKTDLRKHKVSFDEASTVFDDPLARIFFDEEHSVEEPREPIVGYSDLNRLLFVSFVERGRDRIRITSARLATKNERKTHEENKGL